MSHPLYHAKTYGKHNRRVIVLLAGWRTKQWNYWPISRILSALGFRCVTFTFDKDILSPNIDVSIQRITAAKDAIVQSIRRLSEQGIEDISIFGTSLGALISLLVVDEAPMVRKIIFNVPGIDIAESMWRWDTAHPSFKQGLLARYHSLEQVRQAISPINPINHMRHLKGKQVLVYVALKDEVMVCPLEKLKALLTDKQCQFKLVVNNSFGHWLTGALNLINMPVYLDFLGQ